MLALYNTKAGIWSRYERNAAIWHVEFRPEIHDIPYFYDEVLRALDGKTVLEALSQIEPIYRTSVELFYLGEMSYPEIAESLKQFLLERLEPRAARVG